MIRNSTRLLLTFVVLLSFAGCRAQVAKTGQKLSPQETRRVEVMLRARLNIPGYYDVLISERKKSEIPGYDLLTITFTDLEQGQSRSGDFLLSADGKTFGQFSKYEVPQDPSALVSTSGRPARGGGEKAPVQIVVYDDLQCPFCARMHSQLFPALLDRYGDKIRVVYKDFPLGQHAWAIHAAVNANCLAAQSQPGYWELVDTVHARYADLPSGRPNAEETDKKADPLKPATDLLDQWTRDEGTKQKVDIATLNACIAKQDDSAIKASLKEAEALGVDSTPQLFINGEKLAGALPLKYVYKMIDGALVAAGVTPPPAPAAEPAAAPGVSRPSGN